jgi:tRNA pseudouridine38-40 synthase
VRLKLTLEYEGTGFSGWAAQPGLRTTEAVVREALAAVFPSLAGLAVAGRTDTGVHALGQVVSVEVEGGPPPERVADALNAVLPDDVSAVGAEEAPPDFHARHWARSRSYRYRVYRRRERSPFEERHSWWHAWPIDCAPLANAADRLVGEHDFRAFTPTETQHESFTRVVESAAWFERGDSLEFAGRDDVGAEPGGGRVPTRGPAARRGRNDRPAMGPLPRQGRLLIWTGALSSGRCDRPVVDRLLGRVRKAPGRSTALPV